MTSRSFSLTSFVGDVAGPGSSTSSRFGADVASKLLKRRFRRGRVSVREERLELALEPRFEMASGCLRLVALLLPTTASIVLDLTCAPADADVSPANGSWSFLDRLAGPSDPRRLNAGFAAV